MERGRTIGLYGESGSGKTTQGGQYAKWVRKERGKNTVLFTSDMGGYDSIAPLVRLGVVRVVHLDPDDDPWIWIDEAVRGVGLEEGDGLAIFDSGTSQSEALMSAITKSNFQIGQQKTQKFTVTKGDDRSLTVGINNEAHYGLVQGFMLDAIWRSTYLTLKGIDVIWTFSVLRGEEQAGSPILGPKLAGKALTPQIPKWLKYCFLTVAMPQEGQAPIHRLYITEHPSIGGMGYSFGNARYPLEATTPLPPYVEPASIIDAITLIENGQKEADSALAEELGL